MAAGAALSAKRGETSKSSLKGASRHMAESMTEDQLEDFAATKRKKLPTKKTKAPAAKKSARKGASKKAASKRTTKKAATKKTARKKAARRS